MAKPTKAINGTGRNDTLVGTAQADQINGLGGNDIISGLDGPDILRGDKGADTFIFTRPGDALGDQLFGHSETATDDVVRLDLAGFYEWFEGGGNPSFTNIDRIVLNDDSVAWRLWLFKDDFHC